MTALLNRLFHRRDIVNCEREVYLQRWTVMKLGELFAIFIHRFNRSDEDRALHDHPWNFIVVPLWRGYIEHSDNPDYHLGITTARRVFPIFGTRIRRAEYRHRVELIDGLPAWSLFIRFRRRRIWGFWAGRVFQAWNLWWQEKCE